MTTHSNAMSKQARGAGVGASAVDAATRDSSELDSSELDPAARDSAALDAEAAAIAAALREDERRLCAGEPVEDSGVRAPRLGGAQDKRTGLARRIAGLLYPAYAGRAIDSEAHYRRLIAALKRAYDASRPSEQTRQCAQDAAAPFREARSPGRRAVFERLRRLPPSEMIRAPEAMPVEVAPLAELTPFFDHLAEGAPARETVEVFARGAHYADRRIDLCKQVVGPPHIGALTAAVRRNRHVAHFLMGNNIVGDGGAVEIAALLRDPSAPRLETLYLAGNAFTAAGAHALAEALGETTAAQALWLKRNPLGPDGVAALASMLRRNQTLRTLDLVNVAMSDAGAEALFDALAENHGLRLLYIDANALGPVAAAAIARYFERLKTEGRAGLTGLFAAINRFGDDGAAAIARAVAGYAPLTRLDLGANRIERAGLAAVLEAARGLPALRYLGLGCYKSTSDLGELPNYFDGDGADLLAAFVGASPAVRDLDIKDVNLREDGLATIARALEANTQLCNLGYAQFGRAQPPALLRRIEALLSRNVERLEGVSLGAFRSSGLRRLKHTDAIEHIDSIYRNAM